MTDEQQKCSQCLRRFPPDEFIGKWDKPVNYCKKCRARMKKRYEQYKITSEKLKANDELKCARCKKILPAHMFIGSNGNIITYCRTCADKNNTYLRGRRIIGKRNPADIGVSSAKFRPKYERVQSKEFYSPSDLMRMPPEKLARATTKILRGSGKVTQTKDRR